MKPVSILFTIPNFLTAGSGREMMNIIDRLDKSFFTPHIAVQQAGGALYQEAINKGYPIIVAPFTLEQAGNPLSKLNKCREMAQKFKQYRFGIWQSFNWSSDYSEVLIARMSGARYVYVKKNMNWDRRAWKVKTFLADAVIARNRTLLNKQLAPWYFKRKSYLVQGGVAVDSFQKVSSDVRIRYHIPEDSFVICCIAQIVRVKDQATLIKSIIGLPDVFLLLAGAERDEAYACDLRKLVADNHLEKRVFFLGSIGNVNTVLSASDVFVLPTTNRHGHEEGCPVALLEAMAAGLPCIVSNIAGSNDLVDHEKTGLLFTPENIQELKERILALKNSPGLRSRFGQAGYQLVATKNTLDIEAGGFIDVYKRLIRI